MYMSIYIKRDLVSVKRDLVSVKRDLVSVKRDLVSVHEYLHRHSQKSVPIRALPRDTLDYSRLV
jgi:hypothetical protein